MGDKVLIILPLTLAVLILIITFTSYNSYVNSSSKKVSSLEDVVDVDVMDQSCECPSYISEANCSVMGDAVLGNFYFIFILLLFLYH